MSSPLHDAWDWAQVATATRVDPWDRWIETIQTEPGESVEWTLPPSDTKNTIASPVSDDDFFTRLADQVDPQEVHWQHDPVRWAKERCEIELWSRQREIVEAVRDVQRVAVPSCHNTGKSFTAAAVACWWIDSHPAGDAFVLTTAPTGAQVKAILWRNINHVHAAAGLPGRTNLTEWYLGQEMVAMGRKPSEYDEAAFQGIHALHVLVVIDEACGVPEDIWTAAETIASNDLSRILAIGNPDDPHSTFADMCKPGSGWKVIEIGFDDTPNSTGEQVSERVRQSLISKGWAEARKKGWGEHSPLYISKVQGKFPEDAEDGVIAGSWVAACRRIDGALHADTPRCGGLDVGAGGDETVLYARRGRQVFNRWGRRTKDPMELVGKVVRIINDWNLEIITIDVIGVGWGVYGRLQELSRVMNPASTETEHDALIVPFNSAEAAYNDKKFLNKRAELWWDVGREYSRMEAWDLTSIDDDTAAELVAPKYKLSSRGKIQIEAKADVRKRIGRSTDNADALQMAFLENSRMGFVSGGMQRQGRLPS